MDLVLVSLGSGAILGWIALPVLGWAAVRSRRAEPASRARALFLVLMLGSALFALPFAREVLQAGQPVTMPETVQQLLVASRKELVATSFGSFSALALVGAAWVAAVLVAAAREIARVVAMHRLLRAAAPAPVEIDQRVRRLARDAGMSAAPKVLVSDRTSVPFAVGFASPTVILPRSVVESFDDDALDLILLHELTHVARGDLRSNAALAVARALFALHPTARALLREVCLARELAVDALVGRAAPEAYPRVLLDVARHARFGDRCGVVAMGRSDLARRIDALTSESSPPPASSAPVVLLAGAIAASALVVPRVAIDMCPARAHAHACTACCHHDAAPSSVKL